MSYRLLGKDFVPPDIEAKVTGRARYVDDMRVEGALACKLLLSPLPHARVKAVHAERALALPGVVALLRAAELPAAPAGANPLLTDEPTFVGAPILAVAATDERIAAEAVDRIEVEFDPLPFTFDPLESLAPGGPDARSDGNVGAAAGQLTTIKWTAEDFAAAGDGRLPQGKPLDEWSYGDLDAGFAASRLVLDESFVTAAVPHHPAETHSALAYWQNGKCIVHGSAQSHTFLVPALARLIGIEVADLVFVGPFCGGGFGSKGSAYPTMALPALMARKTGRPVMLRLARQEEYFLGFARHAFQGRMRLGFAADGRILAADLYVVQDNGGVVGANDYRSAGELLAVVYHPAAMRFRGIPVFTNTPPCSSMRGPGQNQTSAVIEPILDKAARELGVDRVALRRINAPDSGTRYGPKAETMTSAYLKQALDKGAQAFGWQRRVARSGRREGTRITGVGVGTGFHSAGFNGYDGLVRITPDGKLHVHTGVGNLGTYSYASTSRVPAEILGVAEADLVIERGDSRLGLPWNAVQAGSSTVFTESRTNHVAALDARRKLTEIAARVLGGQAADYDVAAGRVVGRTDPSKSLGFAEAAQRAIALGGAYDGHALPADIHPITRQAAERLAGSGLIGVAKDTLPKTGLVPGFCATFVEIAMDAETGQVEILDLLAVSDAGVVLHPQGIDAQIKGGTVMGLGFARFERRVYDPKNGLPANVGLIQTKPPSLLDLPVAMRADTVDSHEPDNPFGMKGVGEPPTGAAAAAILCAISDALGGRLFNRVPVTVDMIVDALAGQPPAHAPLKPHTA